ncbi:nitroreductase family deazaflavin-dependent oxidoreductase [Nocardia sp. NBC_00416]|uniref:nitroreductase family deazaflavin-dependent oxidoreductase n=1 Tax=Nocardia sp. NBC_00416 TaxID=2975991 RepID=UPI002E1BB818
MAAWDDEVIEQFRADEGSVAGPFAGFDLLLLTTIGAKSGLPHTKPVMYLRDDDRFVVVAVNAGAPANPAWYHNLLAHPAVTVEVAAETFEADAAVVERGPERDRLYRAMSDILPALADYARTARRVVPVVVLTRRSGRCVDRTRDMPAHGF